MNFRDKDIEAFWNNPQKNIPLRVPPKLRKSLYRKLQMLEAADILSDLRVPLGNPLEKLSGSRSDRYSIRVNSQFRLCFIWSEYGAEGVEFVDYH